MSRDLLSDATCNKRIHTIVRDDDAYVFKFVDRARGGARRRSEGSNVRSANFRLLDD